MRRQVDGDSRCGWEAIPRNHRSLTLITPLQLALPATRRKRTRTTCFPPTSREVLTRKDPQASDRVAGPAPNRASYGSFATFSDSDGNGWLLQEVTARLPGRGLSLDLTTLTELLQEAEKRHGEYEPTAPKHHWSGWYAAYIFARENGSTPDEAAEDAAVHVEGAVRAAARSV